jgi:TetR/AcrR family transcriptional regulator, cholesterol catabolism regulator
VTTVAKGARTREGAGTRQAIYEAALDAFAENGYAGASLRDIARRVGIEVASLYNHIDSKEELLYRIIENTSNEMRDELRAAIEAAPPDDPRQRLLQATAKNITYHASHLRNSFVGNVELRSLKPDHYAEAIDWRHNIEGLFIGLVQECVDAGFLPADSDVKVVAYHLLALGTTVPAWFDPSGPLTSDDIAVSATELVLHGLRKR